MLNQVFSLVLSLFISLSTLAGTPRVISLTQTPLGPSIPLLSQEELQRAVNTVVLKLAVRLNEDQMKELAEQVPCFISFLRVATPPLFFLFI